LAVFFYEHLEYWKDNDGDGSLIEKLMARCTAAKLSNNFGRKGNAIVRPGCKFDFFSLRPEKKKEPDRLSENFPLVRFFVLSGPFWTAEALMHFGRHLMHSFLR
jgi:hypothetical protein